MSELPMSELTISEPLQTFFSAWSMTDAEARAATLARSLADRATYADPRSEGVLRGLDAISAYVGMFSANAPGWTAEVVISDTIGDMTRATVAFGGMGPDGGQMVQHGQYFANVSDGKITAMTGFVGTGTPD